MFPTINHALGSPALKNCLNQTICQTKKKLTRQYVKQKKKLIKDTSFFFFEKQKTQVGQSNLKNNLLGGRKVVNK